jgi:hypothetical protein
MSPGKGARRLLSADRGVWTLNVAIVTASIALLAIPLRSLPEFDAGVHIPWWGLALGFLAAERCVVHLHFRRSAHSFSLGDLPLVFGLLFSQPMDLVVAGLVGPIVVLLVERRLPAIKVVFNIAQFTLTTCLAVIVFHELAATVDGFGPATWAFALFACQASAFVTVLLIGTAISLSEGALGGEGARPHAADGPDRHHDEHQPRPGRRRDRRLRPAGVAAARGAARHRLPRVPRVRHRAPAPREPRVPLRDHAHAVALAGDRRRARGPARALGRGVPCRDRRDRAVPVRGQRPCGRRSAPPGAR